MERYNELRQGETGAWVSIIAYVILSAVKLLIGYTFHSEALSAEKPFWSMEKYGHI